jgi:hypothetical protein
MKLITELRYKLPKLVWLAECRNGKNEVVVYHGNYVEAGNDFCVSATWNGDFKLGDFDKTDIIAGTGIRLRNEKIIFVSPANTLDRVVYVETESGFVVSNSLPALFSFSELEPKQYYDYQKDFETITTGLRKYKKTIPTTTKEVFLVYFNNLQYDGKSLTEIPKEDLVPHFSTFADYNNFLFTTASKVSANAHDPARKTIIDITSTCSSGYDSSLATVLGKHMGSKKVLSIANAQSRLKRSDSGENVAATLKLPCEIKSSFQKNYKNEEAIWVSMGDALDLHFTVFDFPQPLSLMLTAFHGDMLWERTPFNLSEFLHRHDPSGASFSEWALHTGVIHMSIGFWAIRRGEEIQKLSLLEEMKPWTLYNNYDRPIPRRIIEEAGVKRGDFALAKRVAAIASDWLPNPWPYSENIRDEFKEFAKSNKVTLPTIFSIELWKLFNTFDWHFLRRIRILLGSEDKYKFGWSPFKNRWVFFYWAMMKMKKCYNKEECFYP